MATCAIQGAEYPALQKVLDVPLSIAAVVDANTTGLPEYILIQDIHRHPEAQAEYSP